MTGLTIGTLTLAPDFEPGVLSYTAMTNNNTNKITASAADDAIVRIVVNGTLVNNGASAVWQAGDNLVVVSVANNGCDPVDYVVTVTKE